MSPLPPHATSRPQEPQHKRSSVSKPSSGNGGRESETLWTTSLPLFSSGPDQFRHYSGPPPKRAMIGAPQRRSEKHLGSGIPTMDALEVGATQSRRLTEQASHDTAQQALAAMRQDQLFYESLEQKAEFERRHPLAIKSAPFDPSSPPRKRKSLQTRDAKPRLQSLAATHPSLYSQPSIKSDPTMPPPPQPKTLSAVHPAKASKEPKQPVNTTQFCHDPKKLTSTTMFDDPRFRMLKDDVDPDRPNVISPLFMIALPFGDLIEGGCPKTNGIDED